MKKKNIPLLVLMVLVAAVVLVMGTASAVAIVAKVESDKMLESEALLTEAPQQAEAAEEHHHWYEDWNSNGNDTHTAYCKMANCPIWKVTKPCHFVKMALDGEEKGFELTMCPVCGATIEPVQVERFRVKLTTKLEKGEVNAFRVTLQDGQVMLVFAIEFNGGLLPCKDLVDFIVPAEVMEGYVLEGEVLYPDGTLDLLLTPTLDDEVMFVTLTPIEEAP